MTNNRTPLDAAEKGVQDQAIVEDDKSFSRQSVRILHVFGRMERGGAELRTIDVMKHVHRKQYAMDFCTLSGVAGSLDADVRNLGGRILPCPLGPTFPGRFSRLLRTGRYDVIHSHIHFFSGYLMRLAARVGVPVRITHFRTTWDDHPDNMRRRLQRGLMRRWIDRYATDILAVNEGSMIVSWRPDWQRDPRCRVIYNGLDLQAFGFAPDPLGVRQEFQRPDNCLLCIHVARLDPPKNHHRLIAIFGEFARAVPSAHLLIVGRGGNALEAQLRTATKELQLDDRIVFAGQRSDVPRLLRASDLMIFPSIREGLPGAVLEASAAGIPVLASDIPGVCEIAQYLPSVRPFSLDEPDAAWAGEASKLAARWNDGNQRQTIRAIMADSPFTVERSSIAHREVWERDSSS